MNRSNSTQLLQEGYSQARRITRQWAKTFYFASQFLSREKQKAAYAIYAICRLSDDAVDSPTRKGSEELSLLKSRIDASFNHTVINDPILLAFKNTIEQYAIPKIYFDELINGMHMDLTVSRYRTFDELYHYCYQVAGVVGLMMLKVFGSDNPEAENHAINLGIAMQLTNILRDIKEDFARGRIYLPEDEMKSFNVSENTLLEQRIDENFISLLKFQIERARDLYSRSQEGIIMIQDKQCRFVVRIMKNMYAAILAAIEKNRYDVFRQRAHVTTLGKMSIATKTLLAKK
ncbi:phytoene/squalene synthase family protein [Candidatus Omnitrophota bacterium]